VHFKIEKSQSAVSLAVEISAGVMLVRLPAFSCVLADIGDEQSLTANLSTFSGHIKRYADVANVILDGFWYQMGGSHMRLIINKLCSAGVILGSCLLC
jgi:hypothetical protein